ncbi:T9SS type A sorting domain-containing protein [Balneolales bacterium ANBcel1]|nr:T9SS type A sorting domain-containing protein [Balneolales bacterium ANBcel1]
MLHSFRESRSPVLVIVLLLFAYPSWSLPPSDKTVPAPKLISQESLESSRSRGTIHIVAVMVEFEEEDNRFTSGNGTFDLPYLQRDDITIGPLPHDLGYFQAHLEFAQNYFQTVSGGQLNIEYTIVPEVLRLDNPMSSYAPLGESGDENYKLAHLARDAWAEASGIDLPNLSQLDQERTMFIVFHAGSGRNIELMGTSLEKTPQDIPSVYLGNRSLERLLEQPGFQGFELGDTGLRVTNTALLPQTQSRAGEDVTGNEYVLELSINGLLVANIGSFLGLPDLFNTESGTSAIGRFGLMDAASIFSYRGMFPPEPSAWEKIYLGWVDPFDIALDSEEPIQLPATSLHQPGSIARHAISADEYFLVENRHRNPSGEPLEITFRTPDGTYVTRSIDPMDERFDANNDSDYDEILEPGVVVNVSSFDWSLPGGPDIAPDGNEDDDTGRLLNGGILIWHIDEAVIRNTIDDNRVNADNNRRGVQLKEADGSQDIGFSSSPERFINGNAFDFWWSGNNFTVITPTGDSLVVYENRFGRDTRPSNESNTGSPSFFEFYYFSGNEPIASFRARSLGGVYADAISHSYPRLPESASFSYEAARYPVSPAVISIETGSTNNRFGEMRRDRSPAPGTTGLSASRLLLLPTESGFYSMPLDGSEQEYQFVEHPDPSTPLIADNRFYAGQIRPAGDNALQSIASWAYENGQWTMRWLKEEQPSGPGFLSLEDPGILHADRTHLLLDAGDGSVLSDERDPAYQRSGRMNGLSALLEDDRFELSDGSFFFHLDRDDRESLRQYTGNLRFSADAGPSFFVLTDHRLILVDDLDRGEWQVQTLLDGDDILSWPAFGDWTGDHALEIFITDAAGNAIRGFNRDGGVLDRFPLRAPRGQRFTGSVLLADITGDGQNELIAGARDSLSFIIHAYDRNHRPVDGFPLLAGSLSGVAKTSATGTPSIAATQTGASGNRTAGSAASGTSSHGATGHNAGIAAQPSASPMISQNVPLPLMIAAGHLFAVSPAGEVRAWELTQLGEVAWGHVYGHQPGNKVGIAVEDRERQRAAFNILNERETYNWPNPAVDHTYIRFETSDPARIDITVISPSGSVIFEKQAESRGRFPEEIRLNTSSWGNGVYFGRVRARNGQGSETKILKIVVTH